MNLSAKALSPAPRAATGPATAATWVIPAGFAAEDQALLTDPQTSGGLLVSCSPSALDAVLKMFVQHGFGDAAVVGQIVPASGPSRLVVR